MVWKDEIYNLGRFLTIFGAVAYILNLVLHLLDSEFYVPFLPHIQFTLDQAITIIVSFLLNSILIAVATVYNYKKYWHRGVGIIVLALLANNLLATMGGVLVIISSLLKDEPGF